MQKEQTWIDIKEIWKDSSKGAKINFQVSELINELKGKMNQFEKDSIKSDINKIKSSWTNDNKKISQFEEDSIKKDLNIFTTLVKKLLTKLRSKNQ